MNYHIIRGHFAPPVAEQIRTHKLAFIKDKLNTSIPILTQIEENSGDNKFLDRCEQALVQKKPSMMPAALKTYFIPQWEADIRHPLNPEKKEQLEEKMFELKRAASLSDEDFRLIRLNNWGFFNQSIRDIEAIQDYSDKHKEERDKYIKDIKTIYGIKVKKDYDIKTYFNSDNFKKTETDETEPEFMIGDSKKIIKEQKEVFNSLNLPGELIDSKEELRTTFETLFEKGRKSKDYSFYSVPLNQTIFNNTIQIIEKEKGNIGLNSAYKKAVMEYQQSQFKNWGIDKKMVTDEQGNEIGSLITIPQTKKGEPNFENRYQVIQTHSCHNWCTHTTNAIYIKKGNFVIYKPKPGTEGIKSNKDNVAFRYVGNEIFEIQTSINDGIKQENIRQILDVLRTETGKTLIKDLSISNLDELNKVATKGNIDLSDINNTYLEQFVNNDNDKLSELSSFDLQDINNMFRYIGEYTDQLKEFNDVYCNQHNIMELDTIDFDEFDVPLPPPPLPPVPDM